MGLIRSGLCSICPLSVHRSWHVGSLGHSGLGLSLGPVVADVYVDRRFSTVNAGLALTTHVLRDPVIVEEREERLRLGAHDGVVQCTVEAPIVAAHARCCAWCGSRPENPRMPPAWFW